MTEFLACFDLETTGVDRESDRIVSAALVTMTREGEVVDSHEWLVNPGVEIPPAATAVHGISTARAVQSGTNPSSTLMDIAKAILEPMLDRGAALAGFNLPFDLTFLDRECRRHLGRPFVEDPDRLRPVLDAFVIDKALDTYRKGTRKLADVCAHYGVPLDDAHNATADAVAAGRLVLRLMADSRLQYVEPDDLHTMQIAWKRDQAESLAAFHSARQGRRVEYDTSFPFARKA